MEEDPDMDIEENTFIYPRIENIYSDVNIKTEPIDIDEDEFESIEIADTSSDYYMTFPNKIILGSKPSTINPSEPIPGPSTASDWEDEDNFFLCAECNLLFPTQNELDSHKMASHSFLVARPLNRTIKMERKISISSASSQSYIEDSSSQGETRRRQKAVKSTSKSALNKTYPILYDTLTTASNNPFGDLASVTVSPNKDVTDKGDRLLCKHCGIRFPDEIALIKHTYELLPESQFQCDICQLSFDTKPGLRGHRAIHFRKIKDKAETNVLLLQCIYCTCFLMYPGFMAKHLLKNHNATEYSAKSIKFTGKCAICLKNIDNYKKYNKHVMTRHRKLFHSRTPFRIDSASARVKLKCYLCNQIFTSRYSAYKHKMAKHPEHTQKQIYQAIYDNPVKPLAANPHNSKSDLKTSKNILEKSNYIPKQYLFKCNKCQIHFVSCLAAFAHSKRCSLAKGDWKCNKCRRIFTMTEKSIHTEQHRYTEKFKVHVVSHKVLCQVLCQCPKCELYFDEIAFKDHITADCVATSEECKRCNLKIHTDSFAKHNRYHNKLYLSCGDFIRIEFVDATIQNVSIQKENDGIFRQKLMYCTTCTCHCYTVKAKLQYHLGRQCETLEGRCCTLCGLTFSKKPYITHMKYDHGTLNLKLDEIKFIRIQDSKVINPEMPAFYQCEVCEIRFISPITKTNHSCSNQVFVKCSKCSQKYDSVTYDIHLTFHNYGRSKEPSSALPLKLYSCVACSYGFHSYDGIVEHCQNHYNSSENLETSRCKICKLYYAESHKILHSTHAKFEIYKFEYEKLFSDDWLNGFNTLQKDIVEDILSKSVYGVLRNVRLKLSVDGPTERTLYKCVQCDLNFDLDDVVKHTLDPCSSATRFDCSSCTAAFRTRNAKLNHMNIHIIYGDDITFREIIFNNKSDKELNEAFIPGRQKESLKFRKCQQCKLLIKISDYQAHVSAHAEKYEVKQFKFRRNNKILSYKLFKPVNAAKKLYTVYKCRLCSAGILIKHNMIRHKCLSPDKYEKCDICSLYFLTWNIKRHIAMHSTMPQFTLKNMYIMEFELLKLSNSLVKKRRRYSSDDDASTGSQVNLTISKTYDTRKVVLRPCSDNLSENSQDLDDASEESVTTNTYAKKYATKNSAKKVDSGREETQSNINITPGKQNKQSVSTIDADSWRIDMKNKLYQCEKCYFCFVHKHLLVSHLLECDKDILSETPLICDRCDIVFHPSMLSFHEKLHELVRQNPIENYFYLINISTNGIGIHNDKRWLYKCKVCDIQYLNTRSLETHFNSDHSNSVFVNCEICGMKFTQISRTRHTRIQHHEGKWSLNDLHIEITQKKIVDVGEIHLRAFVKENSSRNNSSVEIEEILDDSIDGMNERELSIVVEENVIGIEDDKDDSNTASSAVFTNDKKGEIDTNISNEVSETIDNNLYKCVKCSKHYLSKLELEQHNLIENHKETSCDICDICGLSFGTHTLKIHKSVQHGELKLGRKDFVINDLQDETEKLTRELVRISENLNDTDISFDVSLSERQKENYTISEEINEIKSKMKSVISRPVDNNLYKCVECCVYYTNRLTLMLHIVVKKHKNSQLLTCDICGLLFGRVTLAKHRRVQHINLNLTRKDFIISDVFGTRLLDDENNHSIVNASSLNTDALSIISLDDKKETKNKIVKRMENTIIKLYQCKDCRICVQNTERKLHVCCSDIQKKQCIACCLFFRNSDVVQHRRLHRKYRDLSRKNFMLIRFGHRKTNNNKIYKCVSCSTHFLSMTSLEWHMNVWNHQTKRDYCKICGLFFGKHSLSRHNFIHHTKLNLTVQQFDVIYVSDTHSDLSSIESKEMVADDLQNSSKVTVSEADVKIIKKLFKCVECDVHFLTRASYYHHIYKHKKLDSTEYIDCNVCDLQFLNESLGVHMKTHKDKSFCLDKLLIEEYHPNSPDSPRIELYFAKDNVNSKLVSTTTLFDNDDEAVLDQTGEQLSVIDSTSDEIPKARTDEIVDVDATLYPHKTESSLQEETANPTVELPKVDVSVKSND